MKQNTYKGVTTVLSDNLFEKPIIRKNKPEKSYKFDEMSLYYNGRYYFPNDIKKISEQLRVVTNKWDIYHNECKLKAINEGFEYEIQFVEYTYKWVQDTECITKEFKDFLTQFK